MFYAPQVRGVAFVAQHGKVIGARLGDFRLHLFFFEVRLLDNRVLLGGQGDGLLDRDAPRLAARNAGKRQQHQQRRSGLNRNCRCVLAVNHYEQNRDGHQRKEHRSQQPERNHAGQRRPQTRTGDNHGNDAHRSGRRSEEDGPQSPLAGLQSRLLQLHASLHPLVDVVDQDDGVSDDQTAHA